MNRPTLHFFCGKAAAGKSTLAKRLAEENKAILISEDIWLSRLFPDEIKTFQDYIKYSKRLKLVVAPVVQDMLRQGVSVVLDFPGNVPSYRNWMRSIYEEAEANHILHYIDKTDEECKVQLAKRNRALPEGAKYLSEAEFDLVTSYFVPPSSDEGFNVIKYGDMQDIARIE